MIKSHSLIKDFSKILTGNIIKLVTCPNIPAIDSELRTIRSTIKLVLPHAKINEIYWEDKEMIKIYVDDDIKFVVKVIG